MIRWLVTTFVTVMILSACWPWMGRIGIGRLPGDLRFRLFGRDYMFPFTSSILITLIGTALVRWL
ncbi:MAG: DUF2905 domain-containing protein [Janthinobacterium lividum]